MLRTYGNVCPWELQSPARMEIHWGGGTVSFYCLRAASFKGIFHARQANCSLGRHRKSTSYMSQSPQTSTAAVLGGEEITPGPSRRDLCGLRDNWLFSQGATWREMAAITHPHGCQWIPWPCRTKPVPDKNQKVLKSKKTLRAFKSSCEKWKQMSWACVLLVAFKSWSKGSKGNRDRGALHLECLQGGQPFHLRTIWVCCEIKLQSRHVQTFFFFSSPFCYI